jgi:hypothetical protein
MLININFDDTYKMEWISDDLTEGSFYSFDRKGDSVLLKIKIDVIENSLLPQVYNLSFGPVKNETLDIDDTAKIFHNNLSRLFSTIIFFCVSFLKINPGIKIGLDGSTDSRAYLYHRIFQSNQISLQDLLVTFGLDWFVRLLRSGEFEKHPDGSVWIKPELEAFDYERAAKDLYHYYVFGLKE